MAHFEAERGVHSITVIVTVIAVFLWLAPKGIYELSYGVLGLALVFSPINVWLTLRLLEVELSKYLIEVLSRPILLAFAVYTVSFATAQMQIEQWQLTILNLVIGGFIMLAAGFYWERDLFKRKRGWVHISSAPLIF